jgi:hypothetical protein
MHVFLEGVKSMECSLFDVFDLVSFLPVGHFIFVSSVTVKV